STADTGEQPKAAATSGPALEPGAADRRGEPAVSPVLETAGDAHGRLEPLLLIAGVRAQNIPGAEAVPLESRDGANTTNLPPPSRAVPVGPLQVPATNPPGATTSFALRSGADYTLVATGDVRVGALPSLRADAQYQDFRNPRYLAVDGRTHAGLKVEGATVTAVWPAWGSYNPTHQYRLHVVGQGRPIRVWYSDSTYANPAGTLTLGISNGASTCPPPDIPPDCDECWMREIIGTGPGGAGEGPTGPSKGGGGRGGFGGGTGGAPSRGGG